jgi:hypothetical protein
MSSTPAVVDPTEIATIPTPPPPAVKSSALSPSTPKKPVQTVEKFLARTIPPKEPLIEGLLYRRDIAAFVGRRRHGKTSILTSLATALALPEVEFLGYKIPGSYRVLALLLEDDAGELQERFQLLMGRRSAEGRLAIYTREDFQSEGIALTLDPNLPNFRTRIQAICAGHRPDLIIFDNLAHLIGAAYNDTKMIHAVATLAADLTSAHNAAVIIAAHPKKKGRESGSPLGPRSNPTLRADPEGFFEEVMGSSHFVNSCGSLWGIERDTQTNRTDFLGGTQRYTGDQALVVLEKGEGGQFRVVDEYGVNLPLATNTIARQKAWGLLPDRFSYTQGEQSVNSAMKSTSTFSEWMRQLVRMKLVVHEADGCYHKVSPVAGTGAK